MKKLDKEFFNKGASLLTIKLQQLFEKEIKKKKEEKAVIISKFKSQYKKEIEEDIRVQRALHKVIMKIK